jgi:dihydroorotase
MTASEEKMARRGEKVLYLRGGTIVDPRSGRHGEGDLLLAAGRVVSVGKVRPPAEAVEIDVRGFVVTPGLIDMHVHLREPGREDKETIASGTRAAAAGGFTAVACMPNTSPPLDTRSAVEMVVGEAARSAVARVYPIAAITRERAGRVITEMGELRAAGAVAVSDDGDWVADGHVMRRALEYARMVGLPVISHSEDPSLEAGGVMHEGYWSTALGLKGIPSAAEEAAVARDVALARLTGASLHIAHISTAGAVETVRRARAEGLAVTAEATPHHFTLTDEAVRGYDANTRMSPPLRSAADRDAVREGIRDGTIGVLASDHAPHTEIEKDVEFDAAPNGVVGLETAVGLALTELVRPRIIDLETLVLRMSAAPAGILGIPGGTLAPGAPADVTVLDLDAEWTVEPSSFRSLSRNTPFAGRRLQGRPVMTIVGGSVVHSVLAGHGVVPAVEPASP